MTSVGPSTWPRRHLEEICAAVAGIAFGVLFLFLKSPANFLQRIVIISGPNCGKSEALVLSIVADSELQRVFTPLSVGDDDDPDATRVCEVAYAQVLADAPWFRVAGQRWTCARLREAAIRYRDEAHAVLPVWVHDGAIADVEARDRLLEDAGYYLLPGGEGVVLRANEAEIAERSAKPPAAAQSEWRGQTIGF